MHDWGNTQSTLNAKGHLMLIKRTMRFKKKVEWLKKSDKDYYRDGFIAVLVGNIFFMVFHLTRISFGDALLFLLWNGFIVAYISLPKRSIYYEKEKRVSKEKANKMKVLIACEYSGIVREAFRLRGHNAWSCDILDTEIPGQHIKGDVLDYLDKGWDLMIAHPPCTFITNAGARFLYPKGILNTERKAKGDAATKFFMRLFKVDISKICIENPIPSKIYGLPQYSQIIQPFEHGHPFKKATCLWLRNLPLLKISNLMEVAQSTKIAGNWFNKGGKERQKNRSRTFKGIAVAMAEQWG